MVVVNYIDISYSNDHINYKALNMPEVMPLMTCVCVCEVLWFTTIPHLSAE